MYVYIYIFTPPFLKILCIDICVYVFVKLQVRFSVKILNFLYSLTLLETIGKNLLEDNY